MTDKSQEAKPNSTSRPSTTGDDIHITTGHGTTTPNGQLIEQAPSRTQKRNKRRREKLKAQKRLQTAGCDAPHKDPDASPSAVPCKHPNAPCLHSDSPCRDPDATFTETDAKDLQQLAGVHAAPSGSSTASCGSKAAPGCCPSDKIAPDNVPQMLAQATIAPNASSLEAAAAGLAPSICRRFESRSCSAGPPSAGALSAVAMGSALGEVGKEEGWKVGTALPGFRRLVDRGDVDATITIGGHVVRPELLCEDPIIAVFDNLVTRDEAESIIKLAGPRWEQSQTSIGLQKDYGRRSAMRTSYSAYISHLPVAVIRNVAQRLRILTGMRHVQFDLLRYEVGQEFRVHHDGPERLYTFVIYLNDLLGDEDGGETEFPGLDIRVKPKCGSALFFRNTLTPRQLSEAVGHASSLVGQYLPADMQSKATPPLSSGPSSLPPAPSTERTEIPDRRTDHAALPIRRSGAVKYVINAWMIPNPGVLARPALVPENLL